MYLYELHMHTLEGSKCAHSSVHDMVRRYKEIGFAGAVVTNHFTGGNTSVDKDLPWDQLVEEFCACYYEGLKTAKELDFDLLFGVEQGYARGKEALVYGIEPEFLLEHPELRAADLPTWSKVVRGAGGFIAFAHPFRTKPYIPWPMPMPDMLDLVDGFEGYNRSNTPLENQEAMTRLSPTGLMAIAGSDWHDTNFDDANGVVLEHRVHTTRELAKVLKAGEFELKL